MLVIPKGLWVLAVSKRSLKCASWLEIRIETENRQPPFIDISACLNHYGEISPEPSYRLLMTMGLSLGRLLKNL